MFLVGPSVGFFEVPLLRKRTPQFYWHAFSMQHLACNKSSQNATCVTRGLFFRQRFQEPDVFALVRLRRPASQVPWGFFFLGNIVEGRGQSLTQRTPHVTPPTGHILDSIQISLNRIREATCHSVAQAAPLIFSCLQIVAKNNITHGDLH